MGEMRNVLPLFSTQLRSLDLEGSQNGEGSQNSTGSQNKTGSGKAASSQAPTGTKAQARSAGSVGSSERSRLGKERKPNTSEAAGGSAATGGSNDSKPANSKTLGSRPSKYASLFPTVKGGLSSLAFQTQLDARAPLEAKAPLNRGANSPSKRPRKKLDLNTARTKLQQATQLIKTKGVKTPHQTQLQASLSQASMRMMTAQFVTEVRRVLQEQKMILPLLPNSKEWALKILNRQYYAIRTAAELLRQDNLATVAGRAEVLVSLLSRDKLAYRDTHKEVLEDTWELLDSITRRVLADGSDKLCFSAARTAICLYASAEPTTQNYAPAVTRGQKTQSSSGG